MTTAATPLADVRARVSGGLAAHLPEHLARLDWDDERLVAYQVRQTERGIDVSVVADGPVDEVALRGALVASLREAGLGGPEATVRRVADIARHPQTGKVSRFLPAEP
jgi:hypothetical protein